MNHPSRAVFFIFFMVLCLAAPVYSQQLEIHTIDVGQGSSELIIAPDGTTILIDGGTSSKGRTNLLPYLDGIFPPGSRTLDYVIASHDDGDHYGGLSYILDNGYSANTIYHCGYNSHFGRGIPIPVGTIIDLGYGATATCVLAKGEFADGTYISVSDGNDASIGLLIEYGGFDYITAGDLGKSLEDDLANMLVSYVNPVDHPLHPGETYLDPSHGVDVMHVNHHGSRYSSCSTYVNLLRCEIALINGGTGYGHPHRDAVDRLLGRETYTIDCSCSGGSSTCGRTTGVTVEGAEVYRTTAGGADCRRSPEEDCPTIGDMLILYDGGSSYAIEGTYMSVSYRAVDEDGGPPPMTPTPAASPTPTPSPVVTPTPTHTSQPVTLERIAYTSFEEPQGSDPIGYTLLGEVPDDPGNDRWGSWSVSPRTGSNSLTAQDCTRGGQCVFNDIYISGYTGVVVSLWLSSSGNFEGGDYASAHVSVDGEVQPCFLDLAADDLDYQPYKEYSFDVPDGARNISIIYEVRDSANTEHIYLDDVEVLGSRLPDVTPTCTPDLPVAPTVTPTPEEEEPPIPDDPEPAPVEPFSLRLDVNGEEFEAGDRLTLGLASSISILEAFDGYLLARTPVGDFTIHLDGRIARGVSPVAVSGAGLGAPFEMTILEDFTVPRIISGTITFHLVAVMAGMKPPVSRLSDLTADTQYVIAYDAVSIEVK